MFDGNFDPYHEWLGIPADEQPANHYRLLGLELFEEDRDVIDSVSLEQIAHIRTFAIGAHSEQSQSLLNELSAARLALLNAVQKADYDQELRQQLSSTGLEQSSATAENLEAVPAVVDVEPAPLPRKPQRRLSRSFNEVNASPSDPSEKRKLYIRIGGAIVLGYLVFMGILFFIRARGASQEIAMALNRGDFSRVLELDPDNPAALSMRQSASDLADALARKDYKQALNIDPYNAEALILKREDLLGALLARDYEKALDIDPSNAEAKIQQKEAAAKQAVASGNYEQALELDPTNREALAMRNSALAIEKAAEIEEALKAGDYARALRLDSTNPEALAMKQAVERKQAFADGDNSGGLELNPANSDPLAMNEVDSGPPPAIAPFDAAKAKEHQEAWAKYLGVEVQTENSIGMKLRVMPPGTFTMGEGDTAHAVTLTKPFMLGKYEVTQAEYARVMHNNPSGFKAENNPVENVSWNDAMEFCRRMSEIPAEKTAGRVYKLPTEAQWEYSCRAGTTTAYSFGFNVRSLDVYAWYNLNSGKTTHAVGRKKANPWGLCDMHGNVWEWCSDWYGNYPNTPALDPRGPDEGRSRVHRGNGGLNVEPGSPGWNNADYCTSASRGRHSPSFRTGAFGGFRVVCIVNEKDPDTNLDAKNSQSDNSNTPTAAREPAPANAPFVAAKAKDYQEAWAKYLAVEVETENSIGMKLRVIPSGRFTLGENDDAHEVTLTKPFMLGTYEVTQDQYEKVMGVNPSKFKGARNPVEHVSWNDAVEFCRKLSELPAEKAAGNIYRLPTEAEWEFACRAGTTTKYSFGDDDLELGTYAWFIENAGSKTHPVGGKKPNAWGLYDMHGNVMEWCQDRYGAYPSGAVADPTGAASGLSRVLRDGGYTDLAGRCRSAPRNGFGPGFRMRDRGFRVSLSPSGK